MNKLKSISVEDDIVFYKRAEVMEACFSPHMISMMKASARTYDGGFAWFPKEEIIDNNGHVKSGAQSSNWKNHFEKNGDIIVSWLYSDEPETDMGTKPQLISDASPVYCFWGKNVDGEMTYRYVGTYLYDYNASTPRHRVYRRIGTRIDLTPWYSGNGDFEYYDFKKEGIPALKSIYLDNDFSYTSNMVKQFNRYNNTFVFEKKIKETISEINSFPVLKVEALVDKLIKHINELYTHKIDKNFFYRQGVTNDIIGRLIVDIKKLQDNDHNELLRDNYLVEDAGKVLALFDEKYFLYSLSEEETEFYLRKLNLRFDVNDDITEKHNLLYFWKQCISDIDEWSPYRYYEFLKYTFGTYEGVDSLLSRTAHDINTNAESLHRNAYLLTWNPNKWSWNRDYSEMVRNVSCDNRLIEPWTTNSTKIHKGDIVYLMRLGVEPKGIIAKGYAVSDVYLTDHYDKERAAKGERTNHVDAEYVKFLDYNSSKHIDIDVLKDKFPNQQWTPFSSGIEIRKEYCSELNELWNEYVANDDREVFFESLILPDDFEAKRYIGMNRVHLKKNSVVFAVFDMNANDYNLATREEYFKAIGVEKYNYTDNLGPNHAIVKNIRYSDTDILYRLIDYISLDRDKLNYNYDSSVEITGEEKKASEKEEYYVQNILNKSINIDDSDDEIDYIAKPEARKKIKENDKASGVVTYPRDPQKRIIALKRVGFKCEINPEHETFISKSTGMPYMETHHLIPLEYWKRFEYSLDVEANIVCLCSNCHNEIHYGKYAEKLIKPLFESRESELIDAGIGIRLDDLLEMYDET